MPRQPGGRGAVRGEERLAQRVSEGDPRAFNTLYERYHQRLYRYCLSILRDDADAQDALQSTFERALNSLQRDQRNAPLRPWLFRIAHNEAITVIRRRLPDQVSEHVGVAHAQSAEHVAGERDRLATLVADLAQLPERPRSALVMRELQGLSHQDIAIALQTSVGAAKQAIFEARRGLAEAAEGREMTCEKVRQIISDGDRRVLRARRVGAHLRSCGPCTDFARAIPQRRADLRALAPPLAPVAAASILARSSPGLGGHGAGGGLSAATGPTCATGKGALAAALSSKVALGAAVIATATAGTAGVVALKSIIHSHRGGDPAVAATPVHSGDPRVAATSVRSGPLHIEGAARTGRPGPAARHGRKTPAATGRSASGSGHRSGGSGHASPTAGAAHHQAAHAGVGSRGGQRNATARSGAGSHGAKGRARSSRQANRSRAVRPLKGKSTGLGRSAAHVRAPARAAPAAGQAPGHIRHL
jgi:RNA polymerase sigma factor (sigma-70 family)